MRPSAVAAGLSLLALLVTSCVSAVGPTYEERVGRLQPLGATASRLCCYRPPQLVGAGVQQLTVTLDGKDAGLTVPGGYFCVDRAPGVVRLSVYHWVERPVDVTLEAGKTAFVRVRCKMDVPGVFGHCYPAVVDAAAARPEIAKLRENQKCVICPQDK